MPGKKHEKERKRKEVAAICQDITMFIKKTKSIDKQVEGDDGSGAFQVEADWEVKR